MVERKKQYAKIAKKHTSDCNLERGYTAFLYGKDIESIPCVCKKRVKKFEPSAL